MAERLAPEQTPLRVTSRPERRRGRGGRVVRRTLGLIVALALIAVATVGTLHFLAIQRTAQEVRATALIPQEMAADVLVVIARPGQELPMAGTLAALDEAGVAVSLLSLTSGEAQPPDLSSAQDRLAGLRAAELQSSAELVGVDRVTTAPYADGSLLGLDSSEVTATIAAEIAEVTPSVILTVSDLTGQDGDSQAAAAYTLSAAQAEESGVARVWTVTRGDREVAWNALIAPPIAEQAPKAEVGVRIDTHTALKGAALQAHGTQSPDLVAATYPYADRIPAWAYFRFWDREYFTLAWGAPLQ